MIKLQTICYLAVYLKSQNTTVMNYSTTTIDLGICNIDGRISATNTQEKSRIWRKGGCRVQELADQTAMHSLCNNPLKGTKFFICGGNENKASPT